MTTLRRRPLLRFAVLGTILFAVSPLFAPGDVVSEPARVAADEIGALRRRFAAERGRPPDARELQALVEERVDEELLVREALARHLGEGDAVIVRRLAASVAALEGVEGAEAREADRVRTAATLGLDTRDVVVRRRLVNLLRLRIAEEVRRTGPAEADLARGYARRAEALRFPPQVAFAQAYLGPEGGAARARAAALLARSEVQDPRREAQPLPLPDALSLRTAEQVARSFGPEFAGALFELPVGAWSGPVASVHGLHLVRVDRIETGRLPPFRVVREQLREEWFAAREGRAMAALLEALRRQHPVVVEREGAGEGGTS